VAWRRVADAGVRSGLSSAVLCDLADAIFAYIDEIAASSVEGYAQAQQTAAGERERRRRALLASLLAEEFDADAVGRRAADAAWEPPREIAVLACASEDLDAVARRLTQDALAGVVDDASCVVVPDPVGPGRRAMIEAACRDRPCALGPTRPLPDARLSFERARAALAAIAAGAFPAELVLADERLADIALFEARGSTEALAATRLAALDDLKDGTRKRMRETLRAFLDQRGNAAAMAAELHLHPQTVRYRLRQLRELFGDALDDPEARFELDLALRAKPFHRPARG
jgi:hypothetical protein